MPAFFQFPPTTFYRGTGPGVEPLSRSTKKGDSALLLAPAWVDFIFNVNDRNQAALDRITSPTFGPSKGYNNKGLLIYNSLVYPGRNIVKIERVLRDRDDRLWGVVDGIPMDRIPHADEYNAFDSPHLVHKLYGVNARGAFFNLKFNIYAPILGINWYIPMSFLQKIKLPREVRMIKLAVNLRSAPNATARQVGQLVFNQKTTITALTVGSGGIWGETKKGWLALRYLDDNLTDWTI